MALKPVTKADFNTVAQDALFTEQGAYVVNNAENKRIADDGVQNAKENAENKRITAKKATEPSEG